MNLWSRSSTRGGGSRRRSKATHQSIWPNNSSSSGDAEVPADRSQQLTEMRVEQVPAGLDPDGLDDAALGPLSFGDRVEGALPPANVVSGRPLRCRLIVVHAGIVPHRQCRQPPSDRHRRHQLKRAGPHFGPQTPAHSCHRCLIRRQRCALIAPDAACSHDKSHTGSVGVRSSSPRMKSIARRGWADRPARLARRALWRGDR